MAKGQKVGDTRLAGSQLFGDRHCVLFYWISGPRKDRNDRLYGGSRGVEIDDDVKEEYAAYLQDA